MSTPEPPAPTPSATTYRCKCGDPTCPLWREDIVCPHCSEKLAAICNDPEFEGRGGDMGEGHYGDCPHGLVASESYLKSTEEQQREMAALRALLREAQLVIDDAISRPDGIDVVAALSVRDRIAALAPRQTTGTANDPELLDELGQWVRDHFDRRSVTFSSRQMNMVMRTHQRLLAIHNTLTEWRQTFREAPVGSDVGTTAIDTLNKLAKDFGIK